MDWQHILSADQFDRNSLEELFVKAFKLKKVMDNSNFTTEKELLVRDETLSRLLRHKRMVELFYQPSTRTRLSFAIAMEILGGHVFATENAREFSSAAKGETLEDSIRTVAKLKADVIVLRYDEVGGAKRAASVSSVPIINAGDSFGEHPTQALLDLFTIYCALKRIDNLRIVIGGDLLYSRTVHSLARLLALYQGVKIIFVSAEDISLDKETEEYLISKNVDFVKETDLKFALTEADVVYWTRIQKEHFKDKEGSFDAERYSRVANQYRIDSSTLPAGDKPLIMHPLPRNEEVREIDFSVDDDPRAIYFDQVENGLYIRMALLLKIFGINFKKKRKIPPQTLS